MAMAEKLPRRRSSLIFSIRPSPGSVEQRTAALALLNANGEFRYVSSLPGGPAKRESPRCSDHHQKRQRCRTGARACRPDDERDKLSEIKGSLTDADAARPAATIG
jgi:hypothetical protein